MLRHVRRVSMPSTTARVAVSLGALAGCLRLPRAFASSFWQDEVASARILDEHSLAGVLRHVARTESTPPLWYVVGWLVHRAGVSVHDVRLVSVVADALLVTLVVLLAARLLPLRSAALAGGLVALGAQFSAEGRWIRAYELIALLTVVLLFAIVRTAARPTRANLSLLGAVVAAGSLTHYFFLFSLAAAVLWVWLEPEHRAVRRNVSAAVCVGLLPFACWTPGLLQQLTNRRYGWIGPFDAQKVLVTPLRLFTSFGTGPALQACALLSVCVVAFGCVALWRLGETGRLCVALATVPVLLAAFGWACGTRIYDVRNLIGAGPFLAVALAAAAASLPRRTSGVAVAVLACAAIATFGWSQRAPNDAYDRIAHALVAAGWRPGDAVAVFGSRSAARSPLEWYLPGQPRLTSLPARRLDEPLFVVRPGRDGSNRIVTATRRRVPRGASIFVTSARSHS